MTKLSDTVSRDQLARLYLVERLSTIELAQRLGSNRETLRRLLLKYEIPLRPRSYPGIRG